MKNNEPVLGTRPFIADRLGIDRHQRIVGKCGKGVVRLIGQNVAVSNEQDARKVGRLAGEVPAALK